MDNKTTSGIPGAENNDTTRVSDTVAPESHLSAEAVARQPVLNVPGRDGVSPHHAITVFTSLPSGSSSGDRSAGSTSFPAPQNPPVHYPPTMLNTYRRSVGQAAAPSFDASPGSGALPVAKITERALKKNNDLMFTYQTYERMLQKENLRPKMLLFQSMPWCTPAMHYKGGLLNWYRGQAMPRGSISGYIAPKAVRLLFNNSGRR